MTDHVIVFRAPCPGCGQDARWCQHGDGCVVTADDFAVECVACVAA